MSVVISKLTKIFDEQKAVDNISFEVKSGEVLGFLGPNGAGKSTTMKMITCFIPPTSGSVSVCGFDTLTQPEKVKQKIGYLPESNPLYYEMYVREYLSFIASLHPNIENKKKRIAEMIAATGLESEKTKKIGALSKGYKQRVGLAQAMLHDPEVLILDEPTSGLDPNQLVEIRQLIKNLSKEKTIILSTHIMQEVKALCNRVVIINKGKVVADDDINKLQQEGRQQTITRVTFKEPVNKEDILSIPHIQRAESSDQLNWKLYSTQTVQEAVFRFAVEKNKIIISLQQDSQDLEDVFRQLTQN
jgi:ABC-2 type transport system ATP-binding protein